MLFRISLHCRVPFSPLPLLPIQYALICPFFCSRSKAPTVLRSGRGQHPKLQTQGPDFRVTQNRLSSEGLGTYDKRKVASVQDCENASQCRRFISKFLRTLRSPIRRESVCAEKSGGASPAKSPTEHFPDTPLWAVAGFCVLSRSFKLNT